MALDDSTRIANWEVKSGRLPRSFSEVLNALGIPTDSQRVYRSLLRNGDRSFSLDSGIPGVGRSELIERVAHLERHGLVHVDGGDVRTVRPAVAVELLIERRTSELNAELSRIEEARTLIPALEDEWHETGPTWQNSCYATRLERQQQREYMLRLALEARREVLFVQSTREISPFSVAAAVERAKICRQRGVRLRVVAQSSSVECSTTLTGLTEVTELGAHVRVSEKPLDPMIIYDLSCSVVPLDTGQSQCDIVLLRQAGVTAQLRVLFEQFWHGATELPPGDGEIGEGPTETERLVLEVLSRVDTDECAARELNISVRTFRRNVASLLKRLGVSSRFQAAMRAAEMGWLRGETPD
ncbi:hypothetical protein [Streptomyces sp. NPDC050164]|uniref:hypothetical protein n=1 Tax=Streptomyces sp. NPDC050164 TaxID=3365605 RepID=UPI0037A34055